MPNVVATNTLSLSAQRHLAKTENTMSSAMERLASGLRVNSAKDDSAGLAIAERMNAQVRGMNVAIRNAGDGISLAQTAEGALQQVTDTLQRMRELAVQAKNGSNTASDRTNLNEEYGEMKAEVTRILQSTEFNGKDILDAGAGAVSFQVGANAVADNVITVSTTAMTGASAITSATGGGVTSAGSASAMINAIDRAIDTVTSERATYGAAINRFESTIQNLRNASENQAAAKSRIMDADFAQETARLTKAQVLQQSGTAILAQANQAPQGVLSLLR